jgi:dethiobiotin synthetase
VGIVVVTGTSTEVGKTAIAAAVAALGIAQGIRTAVFKPAQTGLQPGEPGDLAEVERLTPGVTAVEFARYPDPLSPEAAARHASLRPLGLAETANRVAALSADHDLVLVEGAGGLLVRFGPDGWTIADLAWALQAPVLTVISPGLGTLNHTALTLEALKARGLTNAGIVIGRWPKDPDLATRRNVRDLETIAGRPLSGALPEGAPQHANFAAVAKATLGPELGGEWDAADFRNSVDPSPDHCNAPG